MPVTRPSYKPIQPPKKGKTYFRIKHTLVGHDMAEGDIVHRDDFPEGTSLNRLHVLGAIEALYDDEGKDLYERQQAALTPQDDSLVTEFVDFDGTGTIEDVLGTPQAQLPAATDAGAKAEVKLAPVYEPGTTLEDAQQGKGEIGVQDGDADFDADDSGDLDTPPTGTPEKKKGGRPSNAEKAARAAAVASSGSSGSDAAGDSYDAMSDDELKGIALSVGIDGRNASTREQLLSAIRNRMK